MNDFTDIDGAIAETVHGDTDPKADKRSFKTSLSLPNFRRAPLLPEAGAAGMPLTAVIAVISALATLSLAAFILIAAAAATWTDELAAAMTVQVKGATPAQIDARTIVATQILENTSGVIAINAVPPNEAAQLLEPWLGKDNIDAYLNIPALIEIQIDPAMRPQLASLATDLAAASDGITLDDHGNWNRKLSNAANSGQLLAFGIFALIMLAACAIAIFAARAGLSANEKIVSLLHLVGATDHFIAREVQRRFFIIGLRGSTIGLVLAIFALGLTALATRTHGAEAFLLPGLALGPRLIGLLLVVPVAICLVTSITARQTVLRTLRLEY